MLTNFHVATEQSVYKIKAMLEDISVWASFHRICPVVAAGVTARRLQSRLIRMAIKLGWLSEYPAQVRLNATPRLLFCTAGSDVYSHSVWVPWGLGSCIVFFLDACSAS